MDPTVRVRLTATPASPRRTVSASAAGAGAAPHAFPQPSHAPVGAPDAGRPP